jgi:hypothetical protein
MDFELVDDLTDVETIATGEGFVSCRACGACMARGAGGT